MTKSTSTYWNALSPESRERWTPIKGLEGIVEELTLSRLFHKYANVYV